MAPEAPAPDDDYVCEILRMEKPLRAFLHRYAPQPADLEDLLQETYSHLFCLSQERRLAVRNIQAFVIASARNVAMDWMRRRQVVSLESMEELGSMPIIDDSARLDEIVHTHQQLMKVAEGIGQLPDRCRQAFTLRRIYGLSQKEIARKFNISEGAVEQLIIRGMRRCAQLMDVSAETPPAPSRSRRWLGQWRRKPGDKK